jgi:hypothetical protein
MLNCNRLVVLYCAAAAASYNDDYDDDYDDDDDDDNDDDHDYHDDHALVLWWTHWCL